VLKGQLPFTEKREGVTRATHTLGPGGAVFVAPSAYHGTLNLSDGPCRFEVVGHPAMMSGYFAEGGEPVVDVHAEPDRAPPGAAELSDLSARWGIEFWTGPTDPSSPPAIGTPA
jgi:hypothetical protein